MSELTDQQIFDRLGAIKGLPTCSQWAEGFADSIREQISNGRTLSKAQRRASFRVLEQNSKEAQKSLANWESEYKMHHKKRAIFLATYYREQGAGYYGDISQTILDGEVPHRGAFLKMINNKFAKRVLKEMDTKPRFTTEDHIIPNSKFQSGWSFNRTMMQSTNGTVPIGDERLNFMRRGGIIIGIDDKIVSAAKGSKRYIVLPFGSTKTYYVEERYLKKKPKVKK